MSRVRGRLRHYIRTGRIVRSLRIFGWRLGRTRLGRTIRRRGRLWFRKTIGLRRAGFVRLVRFRPDPVAFRPDHIAANGECRRLRRVVAAASTDRDH
jgi:hypothetical protein